MLIEWLLMALRVNLCLVGSSGCLRGHLIKGNETSRGLFSARSHRAARTFLRVSCSVEKDPTRPQWLVLTKRPLFWYTC